MATLFPVAGPTLPEYQSLLLKGDYHESAPIYLALSHVRAYDAAKVLILAPSRTRFRDEVKQLKDEWLNEHGGTGKVAGAAMRVEILYPPTPSHLALLLSFFHEALPTGNDFLHPKTTFSVAPSLIIIYEPSSYFSETSDATVSSYMTIITQALSSVATLSGRSGKNTSLAVFDAGLDKLRLPILLPVAVAEEATDKESTRVGPRRESVAHLVQRYFQWIGTVEEDDAHQGADERACTLRLVRVQGAGTQNAEEDIVWHWKRRVDPESGTSFAF
ncbi:hypothetical protein BDW22DRAFT_516611 [Trametopsis cervina]|nr:hypothetical protein BDW22DRAFT_516611 [Trametopsis cervina]